MAKSTKVTKKRIVKVDAFGKAFIQASFNNIIISLTNSTGQVISWASAGKMGFRGSKKTPPMPDKWLPQIVQRLRTITVCAK
jgi:small subunit ribosomal protein S11